jgi:multiple sugar transport system substrate-binding protein
MSDFRSTGDGQRLTRRELLRRMGLASGGLAAAQLLAACGGNGGGAKPTATTSTSTSTQPTTGPTAATGQPTTASGQPTSATGAGNSDLGYPARTDVAGNITFWHFWGSPTRRTAIRRIITEFGQVYPNIKVNEQYVPFGDIWTKNITAVAAGRGMPDVIVEDRLQLRTRAQNKIDVSLGELAKRDNVTGKEFWPFTWEEATLNGEPYGLPYETDIRVLYYNKAAFMDAGLDPNKPPKNWNDLEAYSDKLDKRSGGRLERIGFYPLFGSGLDQWAWNNGGEWMDKQNHPTLNAPPNVEALAWIKKWTERYGKTNLDAFKGTFGQGNQDEFMSGKVAMKVDIQGYTSFLNFYNPKFTTAKGEELQGTEGYGVASIPPAPGHKPASFSGGFALSIPRGSQNQEPAWEFIKYVTFKGQESWARDTYGMPTVEKMAKTDPVLQAQPNWNFFVKAMGYGRPGVYNPLYPDMMSLVGPATDAVLLGQKTPQQALDDAQKKAEQEIARRKG